MLQRALLGLALAATVWLAACGGSDGPTTRQPTVAGAAQALVTARDAAPQRRALAVAGTVDPVDAAEQLMNYGEVQFPEYFPGHPASGDALGYRYRYYEATGIYLGVKDGQVYVLGGLFGAEIRPVGALTQYITPQPRVLSTLCAQTGATHDVFSTPNAAVGRNAGLVIAGCSGAIDTPRWTQTAGPAVTLPADKTQAISFDPPQAGSYAFQLNFTAPDGTPRSQAVSLDVAAGDGAEAGITVRASHAVRMGGKVSVRAWPRLPSGDEVKAVTWTQVEGPAVTLDTSTSRLAVFTAPQVTRDTLVRLRATLHTTAGRMASDEVIVLVERHNQAPASDTNAVWNGDHVARVYPYVANGPYAAVLRRCSYDAATWHSGSKANLCTLGTLPFLAQTSQGGIPSVEQVMARVLVSHDWLGRNFENFLRTHDTRGDFRRMLNSVTAVVLSTHIRPSFYFPATGAIYLDGDSFWLTPEERDTMNEAPDYRSDFGDGLQYETMWRYVRGSQNIFAFFDPRQRITRTLDDVHNEAGWLMFHELGHALDYTPPSSYATLNPAHTVLDSFLPRWDAYQLTSDTVPAAFPLSSTPMKDLGRVRFRGETATAAQKAYTPAQVAGFFSADLATDDYSYTTSFEDIAMTLEEFLMQRRLGIRRDFAIVDAFDSDTTSSSSVIVRWGQRGRVGEALIKPRVREIVRQLAPWADEAEVDQLPAPIAMRVGESWGANLDQAAIPRRQRLASEPPTLDEMARFQRELQTMQRLRHAHRAGGAGPLHKLH
ncbi:hypothetical protein [Aquabacterium humicola]|uniref:hypothetical protein n=1 Tax=Aquabacterium humicola TaxID=3237377 RepID=UPI00254281BA|nr:hypothetical protein [Rubrivivax pictus]